MGRLTTHILDTANGQPAAGVAVRLFSLQEQRALLTTLHSNEDGRTDAPLLDGDSMQAGTYELEFDIGDYESPSSSRPSTRTAPLAMRKSPSAS